MLKKVLMIATIFTFVGANGSDVTSSFAKAYGLNLPALTLLMEKNPTITPEVLESPTKSVMAQVRSEISRYQKVLNDQAKKDAARISAARIAKIERRNRHIGSKAGKLR